VLGRGEAKPHVVALVGPPGCGKTTTLVKLAVNYGLASRRPVMLLSMDTYRVAAADQLRSYSAILGVGFQVLETVASLAQTIEENRGKELIFIDTPGFAFGDLDAAADLAQFLSTRQDIDTQLVLPSSMKAPDLTRMVDAFEVFRPQRLLRSNRLMAQTYSSCATPDALSETERERLILEHLPQVRLIARRIQERLPENITLDDLVSTGVIGLISAIDHFDPTQNVKLKT